MSELFDPENREKVKFNSFGNSSNKSQAFKESLVCFGNVDNHFSYAVVYGLMYCKSNGGNVFLENVEETLGNELFIESKKIEKSTMLNHSVFSFFDPCKLINDVLCEYGFFLRFYERRNKFRYQLKRKLKEKNQMKRELSACIIQKFNGYELLRNHLNSTERKNFIPIDIVYEPTLNEKKTIICFFAPEISLGYYTSYDKMRKRKNVTNHTRARQCHYCNNFFIKSAEKMQKHLSCCVGKAGFTFSFDNGKIIDYQGHYKNLGDLPFAVYYDFETTTGSIVFLDARMYVVSYCMIVAFHPELKIPRLVIFRSYDQSPNALISLTHFQTLQYDFFDNPKNFNKTTLKQLEEAAFSVQNREKNTALAEMFSIELKFIVDCLKFWFEKKPRKL